MLFLTKLFITINSNIMNNVEDNKKKYFIKKYCIAKYFITLSIILLL